MSIIPILARTGNHDRFQHGQGRTRISCPHPVVTGLDKLEVTLHLRIFDPRIFDRFALLKAEVQQGMKPAIAIDAVKDFLAPGESQKKNPTDKQ